MQGGIPLPMGVRLTQSRGPVRNARQARLEAMFHPQDPSLAEMLSLVDQNDELKLELQMCKDKLKNMEMLMQIASIPRFSFDNLMYDPNRIHDYTRFRTSEDFLAYVDLLCNGDRSMLYLLAPFSYKKIGSGTYDNTGPRDQSLRRRQSTRKSLEPIDEAFIYFSRCNSIPSARLAHEFGVSTSQISLISIKWARFENMRIRAFGEMLTWDLYQDLNPPNWQLLFPDTRVHLWDTTDIRLLGKPSNPQLQQLFWNQYYKGNVVKAGVGMTPFGWLMAGPCFTGGQGDTTYLEDSGIYLAQQELADRDGGPPCLNYTDRGFKDTSNAWLLFRQQLMTPCFLRNGKFSPIEVLLTTDRANKRARNERAVRLPKLLMNSVALSIPPPLFDLIWLNNVFRCNFLFNHLTSSEVCQIPFQVRDRLVKLFKD